MQLNECLGDEKFLNIENKTIDNVVLLLCNFYNFKLFSANLLLDLLEKLGEMVAYKEAADATRLEKVIDIILLIFRCVGFSIRKDSPVALRDFIVKLHLKINSVKTGLQQTQTNSV